VLSVVGMLNVPGVPGMPCSSVTSRMPTHEPPAGCLRREAPDPQFCQFCRKRMLGRRAAVAVGGRREGVPR
jgi:hypothetical protein